MSTLSDQLLVAAITTYLLAMVCYAAEYAFGPGGVTRAVLREHVLIGGAAPEALPEPGPVDDGAATTTGDTRIVPVLGRLAVLTTAVGALAHAGSLAARGWAAHRVPWGNMYEFIIAVTLVGSLAWLGLVIRRPALRPLGLFVTLTLVGLLGLDAAVLYTSVAPLVPALNSYWLKIHVTLAILASGIFLVGFCAAVLHLVRAGYQARLATARPLTFPYTLGPRLPLADRLERLAFRIHAFAFPIWTSAIIFGAIWGEAAWGRYWGWDPKETWAFIAWVTYAAYLHARATPSVARATASRLAVIGWTTMMINLFVVNIFVSGLHSYAGVK